MTLETDRADDVQFRIGLDAIESGTGRLVDEPNMDYDGAGIAFQAGDVLFGKLRPYLAKAWLADRSGAAVGDFHVYRPVPGSLDPAYLRYVLLSEPFLSPVEAASQGAKMPRADWRFIRNMEISLPDSIAEQRAIADYLDHETAQVDAFIAKNKQLIDLLRERRAAVIEAALGPLIGQGSRLKPHLPEIDARAGAVWRDLPLLSVSIAWGVRRRDEITHDEPTAADLSKYKIADEGDIVLNRMRAFQGALGVSRERGIVSPDYAVLRPAISVDASWIATLMKTTRFVGEMTQRLKGIGSTDSGAVRTPRINVADLGAILVHVPTVLEQRKSLEQIDEQTTRIDSAIDVAERGVALARERRAALISATVNGQFAVTV